MPYFEAILAAAAAAFRHLYEMDRRGTTTFPRKENENPDQLHFDCGGECNIAQSEAARPKQAFAEIQLPQGAPSTRPARPGHSCGTGSL